MKKLSSNFYFFTLLEILLVISLIALVGSFAGVRVHRQFNDYRFQKQAKQFKERFIYAARMAQVNQADIFLEVREVKGRLAVKIGTDQQHGFFLEQAPEVLYFSDFLLEFEKLPIKSLYFLFSPNGYFMPQGKFSCFDRQKRNRIEVDLLELLGLTNSG